LCQAANALIANNVGPLRLGAVVNRVSFSICLASATQHMEDIGYIFI
jgi:hypothetical protein